MYSIQKPKGRNSWKSIFAWSLESSHKQTNWHCRGMGLTPSRAAAAALLSLPVSFWGPNSHGATTPMPVPPPPVPPSSSFLCLTFLCVAARGVDWLCMEETFLWRNILYVSYRFELKGAYVLPCKLDRTVEQQQEKISPNHVQTKEGRFKTQTIIWISVWALHYRFTC